ncbi:Mediator of RNA polymerase II transcription subunit 18 [Ascosphaera acerosa]|nr:Mediator of RNA polymerase II transcription subunit 18 [Ascosphaera acerosa]
MHQHLLFAPIPASQHRDALAQLTGVAAMQPVRVLERRLVFKPFKRPGQASRDASGAGAGTAGRKGKSKAQAASPPPLKKSATAATAGPVSSLHDAPGDAQSRSKLLNSPMHYLQVVGQLKESDFPSAAGCTTTTGTAVVAPNEGGQPAAIVIDDDDDDDDSPTGTDHGKPDTSTPTTNGNGYHISQQEWEVQFIDTPIAGSRLPVTTRTIMSASLPYSDPLPVLHAMGFNYVSEHVVEGYRFVVDGAVLLLHRALVFPASTSDEPASASATAAGLSAAGLPAATASPPSWPGAIVPPASRRPHEHLPPLADMQPVDPSGAWLLQASLTIADGAKPDLIRTGGERLVALRNRLRGLAVLDTVDRLALDTRVK